jgi:uncharacterized membrane protein
MTASVETQSIEQATLSPAAEPVAQRKRRLWEIDFLRGTAVITMIVYHFGWDLAFLGAAQINPYTGFWYLLQRYTCITFITLAGLSVTLANQSLLRQGKSSGQRFWHFVRRGLWVFFWGMVITVVLWVAGMIMGAKLNVEFGVLHLIGVSTILAYPFLRFKWLNVIVWVVLFALGSLLMVPRADNLWLVWLGLFPEGYSPVDYFPLIPWFGVFLLGVAAGNWLYPGGVAVFPLTDRSQVGIVRFLRFIGRHSLPIYMVHQLFLFAIAYAIAWLKFSRMF